MKLKYWFAAGAVCVCLTRGASAQEPVVPHLVRDGVITQVLVNPRGEPDGLVLRDGTLVRFPPHALQDGAALRVGAQVRAEGEPGTTPNGITLFDARVSGGGHVLADAALSPPAAPRPPPAAGPDSDLQAQRASGIVRTLLASPDGVIDGFILEDGTVVHAGPHARLSRLGVIAGSKVVVTGLGGAYPQGRSLRAETLQVNGGPAYQIGPRVPAPPPAGHAPIAPAPITPR